MLRDESLEYKMFHRMEMFENVWVDSKDRYLIFLKNSGMYQTHRYIWHTSLSARIWSCHKEELTKMTLSGRL